MTRNQIHLIQVMMALIHEGLYKQVLVVSTTQGQYNGIVDAMYETMRPSQLVQWTQYKNWMKLMYKGEAEVHVSTPNNFDNYKGYEWDLIVPMTPALGMNLVDSDMFNQLRRGLNPMMLRPGK